MGDKTEEYTRAERDQLWNVVFSLYKDEYYNSGMYFNMISRLAGTFRSGNVLSQDLLPDSSWEALNKPLEDMPLYLNSDDLITQGIAKWRLTICK